MPSESSSRLVIDTSVTWSCVVGAIPPVTRYCRDFLLSVEQLGFCIVLNQLLVNEWNYMVSQLQNDVAMKKELSFAVEWRVRMVSKRAVVFCRYPDASNIRGRLQVLPYNSADLKSMDEDCHLLEAAVATDRVIISLDNKVRDLFAQACRALLDLQNIVWVTPSDPNEQAVDWLERGAPDEPSRKLIAIQIL